jgi:Zn-dependent metalloprotease
MEPKNITSQQQELLKKLQSSTENFIYEWDEMRGILSFCRADKLSSAHPNAVSENKNRNENTLTVFLDTYDTLFGPDDLLKESRILLQKNDNIGWQHLQFQQYHVQGSAEGQRNTTEVYGAKLAAHFNTAGELIEVQSSCFREFKIKNKVSVSVAELQKKLLSELSDMEAFSKMKEEMRRRKEDLFPLMQKPRTVIYPWKGSFIYALATYGFAPFTFQQDGIAEKKNKPVIAFGQMFFNAETAELFLFAPTRKGAETATTGSGTGCVPLGGPYATRSLDIVRVDSSSTYLLKNKTKGRDIVTYDANADSSVVYPNIPQKISDGLVTVSTDNDGDHNWSRTASSTTDAERTASQQPEVDEHFMVSEIYDWYHAVGGRVGWDDNDFAAPLVPDQTLNVVAHCYDGGSGTSRSVNAFFDKELVSGHWLSHLAFFDGDPTGATVADIIYDYLAGSLAIVAHEYQHAVTDFSFIDGAGNPGLTYSGWFAAIHEGTSDVFGGLISADWWMANSISPTGQIFRNLAFPRDTSTLVNAALNNHSKDHFDDRNLDSGFRYDRGTILAHCAYLMAQGGVHQRSSRTPVLIPVKGLGRETVGGKDVYKAARIWYRALSLYLSNIGAMTGIPTNDENIFRSFRNATISAAIDLYGANSIEHKTTILAWYALGLHPVGTDYGADLTFLTWGADWWMSRPYIGITSPDWSSMDLFINNGGSSEWNAKVNVYSSGSPTDFENHVYCRVRNVGTAQANNVQVQFEYAKCTTGGATWFPMTDIDGNIQVLSVGNLASGTSNFNDSAQNTPPATAMVKWWIPPIESGETVNHYCIRARAFSITDTDTYNNEVQSNIAYAPYVPGSFRMGFFANNPMLHAIPLELSVTDTLPKGWNVRLIEQVNNTILKPGESIRVHADISMPANAGGRIEAPFDGKVTGKFSGKLATEFIGSIFTSIIKGDKFQAQMAVTAVDGSNIVGKFIGTLDTATARFKGILTGNLQSTDGDKTLSISLNAEGCLRPTRVVNIGQYYKGQPLGGISVQVQVPLPEGSCFEQLPPTDTFVIPEKSNEKDSPCLENALELVNCLDIHKENVCSVKIKSILVEIKFKDESC